MDQQQYPPRRGIIVPLLVLLLVAMTCLALYAFLMGTNTQAESEKKSEEAEILTAKVVQQTLAETYQAPVSVVQEGAAEIAPPVSASSVVTREAPAVGTVLESGDVVATIDERPLFIFEGGVPAYRDLAPGVRGEDVAQVQRTLVALGYPIYDELGEYGKDTANAVYLFYLNSGYYPPGNVDASQDDDARYTTSMPRSEYFFVPHERYTVSSLCGEVGKAPQQPLCTVGDGSQTLRFSVDSSTTAQAVKPEQQAVVTLKDGQRLQATVGQARPPEKPSSAVNTDKSADSAPESQQLPPEGKVQYFELNIEIPEGADFTESSVIVTTASSSPDAITVPEPAVSVETSGRQYVLVNGQQVDITTGHCQGGYCEVKDPNPLLTPGAELTLP
ncbi:peptidoglycan-binding protein [Rothia sp. ZJ1223]|uniref:peptidoglycan-binding domain-containing protein n=1 Tax=Rothia sp. ZJ1223 TaxID=2811098 RepID=UPI00195D56FE|nr:peptidoglycan-binding domain-containing protein [Rothia sp. ZJ1223]MBM7051792.1 peptidoglycan-binding protein [Rothia sp. ZJ1223]